METQWCLYVLYQTSFYPEIFCFIYPNEFSENQAFLSDKDGGEN